MKEIRITLTDEQHEQAEETKGGRSWREAFLEEFGVVDDGD